MTERLVAMSGYSFHQLVGQSIEILVPERAARAHTTLRRRFDAHPRTRRVDEVAGLMLRRHDGSHLEVAVALSPLTVNDEPWTAAFVRDDSERRLADAQRTKDDLRYRLAFENNLAPMVFTTLEHKAFAINDAFCAMTGYERDEILGKDSRAITYREEGDATERRDQPTVEEGELPSRYVKRYVHKDGRVIIVEVARAMARDDEGHGLYYVISQNDITERVQRNTLLRLHNEVNTMAAKATTEEQLRQKLCETLVRNGYSLAWIGAISSDDPLAVDVVCAAGSTGYLGDDDAHWGIATGGEGPTTRALRTGQGQIINDLARHVEFAPWAPRAQRFRFGSMVALPAREQNPDRALVIYHRDAFAFDEITVAALSDVVHEMELAATRIRSAQHVEESLAALTVAHERLSESQRALSGSEQRFRLAFEFNMAPMIFSDHDDIAFAINDAFCEMVGFSREELLGHESTQFTLPEDIGISEEIHRRLVSQEIEHARYVKRYLRKDGSVVISEVSKTAARDNAGATMYFLSSERDVTEERALTAQLSHQALHDPLTGLANRLLFEDRLAQAHARVSRNGGVCALLLLDLDDFKGVNDTHGHLVGDQLLVELARRFETVSRNSDTLCRFGGDEFLLLIEGLSDAHEAEEAALRLLDVFEHPFSFGSLQLRQTATIGVVAWDHTNDDSSELLRYADVALHEAKNHHKGGYALFTPSMVDRAISRFTLAQELRRAVESGDLVMHYQPIVELATGTVVGFESLMRWHHPDRGMVPPDLFIALAEQSHLIVELGAFAMRHAVKAASQWSSTTPGGPAPYITVNLSAHQLHHPGLIAMIEQSLADNDLSPCRLILEITESAALTNIAETLEVIEQLRRIGVGIALDDFGTGFSSLSYLTLLQPRIIKIDRSFVSPAHESAQNDTLLEAIVSLGTKLEITILAEGIETPAQLHLLRSLDCQLGQGFLFSAAVPLEETGDLVGRTFCFGESETPREK